MPTSRLLPSAFLALLALTGASFAQFPSTANLNFSQTNYVTSTGPYDVAVGDFNHDGKEDLAVAGLRGGAVSILLGNGDGTFKTHVDYLTASVPNDVRVADLNGDGNLDLVTTNPGSPSTISVLLGNGDGTFQTQTAYTAGTNSYFPTIGDFNNDGKLDIMVTNFTDSTFSLLLGNGDGTFQTAQTIPGNHQTLSIAAADFNHDGNLDFAGADSDNNLVTVYLGKGNGSFASGVDYTGGSQPVSLVIGDFNGDKIPDLAVANVCADTDPFCVGNGPGTTSIFLGNGDGTFQPKKDFSTGYDSLGIALGDFNGDGKLDVAVANGCNTCNGPGSVTVQLGNGDGTLQTAKSFVVGILPNAVATGNFDGSQPGSADIAVCILDNYIGDTVGILLNQAATRMTLSSTPNPSKQGQTVVFTVTVTAAVKGGNTPTGTVTLYNGKTQIAQGSLTSGSLSLSVSSLPEGRDNIRALYAGDTNFNRALSKTLVQVVKP